MFSRKIKLTGTVLFLSFFMIAFVPFGNIRVNESLLSHIDTTKSVRKDSLVRISDKVLDSMRRDISSRRKIDQHVLGRETQMGGLRLDSLKLDSLIAHPANKAKRLK